MTDFDSEGVPVAPQTPAGWYPSEPGWQQYWDGLAWTEHRTPLTTGAQPVATGAMKDETGIAVLTHIGGLVAGFIVPLVIYLIKKDESPFLRHHAAEALNFHITLMIAYTVSFILIFVIIGIFLFPLLILGHFVLSIVAAVAANKGEYYRYPLTLRMVT